MKYQLLLILYTTFVITVTRCYIFMSVYFKFMAVSKQIWKSSSEANNYNHSCIYTLLKRKGYNKKDGQERSKTSKGNSSGEKTNKQSI